MALRTQSHEMGMHTEKLSGRTQQRFFSPSEEENFTYPGAYDVDFNKRAEFDAEKLSTSEINLKIRSLMKEGHGTIVMNPPYGERIAPKGQGQGPGQVTSGERFEGAADAGDFYARLASHWKKHYAGWTAQVLTPESKLPGLMRLKESRRVPMWNGPIECRLFRFDMVAGGNRAG